MFTVEPFSKKLIMIVPLVFQKTAWFFFVFFLFFCWQLRSEHFLQRKVDFSLQGRSFWFRLLLNSFGNIVFTKTFSLHITHSSTNVRWSATVNHWTFDDRTMLISGALSLIYRYPEYPLNKYYCEIKIIFSINQLQKMQILNSWKQNLKTKNLFFKKNLYFSFLRNQVIFRIILFWEKYESRIRIENNAPFFTERFLKFFWIVNSLFECISN